MIPVATIVIPVYNGENYLARLIESLQNQTFSDFKVVLVDDCSTDGSAELLAALTSTDERFLVLSSPTNLGTAPLAVNLALPHIDGDYFLYASQDDFFSSDWLDEMVCRAHSADADATLPDMVFYRGENDQVLTGLDGDRTAVITGREAAVLSLDWTIPGCALWKTSILREVGYPSFSFDADEYAVRRMFHLCTRVAFSGGTYYYNQLNEAAVTKQLHPRLLGTVETEFRLAEFLRVEGYPGALADDRIYRAATHLVTTMARLRRERIDLGVQGQRDYRRALDLLRGSEVRSGLKRHGAAAGGGRLVSQIATRGLLAFESWLALSGLRARLRPTDR